MEFLQWLAGLIAYIQAQSDGFHFAVVLIGLFGAWMGMAAIEGTQRLFGAVLRRIEGRPAGAITADDLDRRLVEHRRLLLTDGRRLVLETRGEGDAEVDDAEEVAPAASTGRATRRVSAVTKIRRQAETVLLQMAGDEWKDQRAQLQRLTGTIVPAIVSRRQEVTKTLGRLRKLLEKHQPNGADGPGVAKTREQVATLERLSSELEGQLDQILDSLIGMEAAIVGGRHVGAGVPESVGELTQLMERVEGNARALADAMREVNQISPAQT